MNILREDWKPVLNLNSVLVGLQYLFLEPNADDPLNKGMSTYILYRIHLGAEVSLNRRGGRASQEQGTVPSERQDLDARREHSRSTIRQGHRAMIAHS